MNAPFYKFDLFNHDVSLIIAFGIGLGFGFFLERAGFGSAKKLAAQFYFRDMSVLKVMFSAIVTAMLGIFYLSWIGFVDLNLIYLGDTYLLPQIAGGLLLGIGFVVGGYCPGTSCVAVSTGRIDGIIYLVGVMAGIFFFGEIFPSITGFFYSTNMGEITLPELVNLPFGLIVFLVVLMAIGVFAGAEWSERKFGKKA
ncbi:MAG TPA: YeeE/YedE thiosulfate transporter family protein [Ignavibacteriaceae bacterium]|nr:YeeE/YedE thiosulfate transporter family protein [Ignavibacteriaceae bacterium]